MKKYLFILLSILALSCSNDSNNENNDSSFDTKQMISDITSQIILPSVEIFKNEATTLNTAVESFIANPSEANLNTARLQWITTAKAYANVYAFNIGAVKSQFMHKALFNWPTLPNAIENYINNNTVIDATTVANFSLQAKTISSIEYLLFKSDLSTTAAEYSDVKRQNYLKYTTLELKASAERLEQIWNTTGENYSTTFINNEGTGINSSLNLLYNGLYNIVDTARLAKVGKPAGLENSSNTNPEELQAYFSRTSTILVVENLKSVQNIFFNTNSGLGISDNIEAIAGSQILSNELQTQLTTTINALNTISEPLFDAITNGNNDVVTAHQEIKNLEVLLANDVRSMLSIVITPTDNDGD